MCQVEGQYGPGGGGPGPVKMFQYWFTVHCQNALSQEPKHSGRLLVLVECVQRLYGAIHHNVNIVQRKDQEQAQQREELPRGRFGESRVGPY